MTKKADIRKSQRGVAFNFAAALFFIYIFRLFVFKAMNTAYVIGAVHSGKQYYKNVRRTKR